MLYAHLAIHSELDAPAGLYVCLIFMPRICMPYMHTWPSTASLTPQRPLSASNVRSSPWHPAHPQAERSTQRVSECVCARACIMKRNAMCIRILPRAHTKEYVYSVQHIQRVCMRECVCQYGCVLRACVRSGTRMAPVHAQTQCNVRNCRQDTAASGCAVCDESARAHTSCLHVVYHAPALRPCVHTAHVARAVRTCAE